jgi:Histidine-specific methyltransferase, SAM-dependent
MTTLVNSRIAKELGVSKVTIGKYIEDALEGKNLLETTKVNNKVRLIDSPHNWFELKKLAEEGRKFRPGTAQKSFLIDGEFYELFDKESQFEIIRDLEIEKQIDLKYYYHKQGAKMWDSKEREELSLISVETEKLLDEIKPLVGNYFNNQEFNLIDIGSGNGSPADLFLKNFDVENYVACDISPDILDSCEKNITEQFPGRKVSKAAFDFQRVSLETQFHLWNNALPNLFLLIGSTICNYSRHDRSFVLNSVTRAMDKDDLLLIGYTLDTDKNKSSFSYVSNIIQYWLPQILGIDIENIKTEAKYIDKDKCKRLSIILDKSYNLQFNLDGQNKQIFLNQGEKITLWQHYVFALEEVLAEIKEAGLHMNFAITTDDIVVLGCRLALK